MSEYFRIRNTIKYPTSLIVNASSNLGLEIAKALLEQGGYVILVDVMDEFNLQKIFSKLGEHALFTVLDYSAVPHLPEDLRRLDYVFYLQHDYRDVKSNLTSQEFLRLSNYLDSTMQLAAKFEAKYLLASSMTAHQLGSQNNELRFVGNTHKASTYNPVELQRYAENLCLEYAESLNLNSRIIRLGEVIGEGIDFLKQSTFNKIVLATAAAQDIVLPGDGLESEYYISVMDAAYAVVKAQFSKDTIGEVYSAAYENPITALSIAYRLQDLETHAGQITFDSDQPTNPSIRLYRPANFLTEIGWRSNVGLDDALKDSLTSAKQFLLHAQDDILTQSLGEANPILKKLRDLVHSAKKQQEQEADIDSGPVSRLIAQRKQQQSQKDQSLQSANDYLKIKQSKRQLSRAERINNWSWNFKNALSDKFGFLKNLTPIEFGGIIMLFVLTLVIYLGVISPGLVFARNHLMINDELKQLDVAVSSKNLTNVVNRLNNIQSAAAENTVVLSQSKWLFDLIGLSTPYTDLQSKLSALNSEMQNAVRLGASLKSLDAYLQAYKPNLHQRTGNDNYVNLTATPGYSTELANLGQDIAIVQASKERIQQARAQLVTNISGWPSFVSEYYGSFIGKVNAGVDLIFNYADLASYAPEMFGLAKAEHYLIAVVDNTRPMPIGGEISSIVLLSMQDGAVVNAQVQQFDAIANDNLQLVQYLKDELNLTRFNPSDSFQLRDLAFMHNFEDFAVAARTEWQKRTNLTIDAVVLLDLEALGNWATVAGVNTLEQQSISLTDLPRTIEILQAGNNNVQRRNDLITQLAAATLEQTSANWAGKFYQLLPVWVDAFSTNSLRISATNSELQKLLDSIARENPPATEAAVYTQVHLISDRRTASGLNYPGLEMLQILNITNAASVQTSNYYLKFPNITGLDQVAICVSKSITSLQINNIPAERLHTNRGRSSDCYIADLIAETDLSSVWSSAPIDLQGLSQYNFTVGIGKITGLDITADLEISFPQSFALTRVAPLLDQEPNRVLSKLILRSDQTIELEFKTQ